MKEKDFQKFSKGKKIDLKLNRKKEKFLKIKSMRNPKKTKKK